MENIASFIDHTLLNANATTNEIKKLCDEAIEYGFYSVCVNPIHVAKCRDFLRESKVKVATVIGFPLGANTIETKRFEAQDAIKQGADELDMVINIGALKDNNLDLVKEDIKAVVDVAKSHKVLVKVIIETALLEEEEKITACKVTKEAGADFVKTSTGFSTGGATPSDIELMKSVVGDFGIKASGGVRDYNTAIKMIEAGATRIGASSSIKIVNKKG